MDERKLFEEALVVIGDSFRNVVYDNIRYKSALEKIATASVYDERGETEVPSAMRMKKIAKDALEKKL